MLGRKRQALQETREVDGGKLGETALRRDRRHKRSRPGNRDGHTPLIRLEEEVRNQEAEQTQPGHNLERYPGLGWCVLLLQCCRSCLGLATRLPLPQALIRQSIFESLNLRSRFGKLGLELIGRGQRTGHSGLCIGEGTSGFAGRRGGLRLRAGGLFGEFGRRNG